MSARNRPLTAAAAARNNLYAPRDVVSALASVIGFRDRRYRRRAVNALALNRGDTVVEVGCGTGRNFRLLEEAVGSAGRLIAVDASDVMLARAQRRAIRHGWSNVELVHDDAAAYKFPAQIDGVLATYSLVAIANYDQVLQAAFGALNIGKRCTVLDQKLPSGLAARLVPIVDWLSGSIPYRKLAGERRVWESIQRCFGNVQVEEFYFGFVYTATGEKRGRVRPARRLTNAEADKESEELRRAPPGALVRLPCSLAWALGALIDVESRYVAPILVARHTTGVIH